MGSGLTLRQETILAIAPKCTSSISIPCSIFIIYEVISDHRTKRGTTTIQRALVGMSCVDILASSAWFLSTWAVPKGSFALAAGNRASCNFQGFLLQLAVGAPLYNSSLALFYLLIIKLRWTDDQLAKIERWVHGFILTFTIGTSILLLPLGQYNHIGAVCWVIGDPPACGNSSYQSSDVPCVRGDHAYLWGVFLFYGPLWVCVIACVISMFLLYLEVKKTHQKARRYSTAIKGMRHSMAKSGGDTSKVATQAILYSLTFIITWMPSTLWSVAHWFNWSHYGLDLAAACAEPLQGFWNMLIFLKSRPRTVLRIKAFFAPVLPCCLRSGNSQYNSDRDTRASFVTGLKRRFSSHLSTNFSTFSELDKTSSHKPLSMANTGKLNSESSSSDKPAFDGATDDGQKEEAEKYDKHIAAQMKDISDSSDSEAEEKYLANYDDDDNNDESDNESSSSSSSQDMDNNNASKRRTALIVADMDPKTGTLVENTEEKHPSETSDSTTSIFKEEEEQHSETMDYEKLKLPTGEFDYFYFM